MDELPLLLFAIGIILLVFYFNGKIDTIMLFAVPLFVVLVIIIPLYVIKANKSPLIIFGREFKCLFGHTLKSRGHGVFCIKCEKWIIPQD